MSAKKTFAILVAAMLMVIGIMNIPFSVVSNDVMRGTFFILVFLAGIYFMSKTLRED